MHPIALLLALAACKSEPADSAVADPCSAPAGSPTLDSWGGDQRVQLEASGWFRTEKICDRWWFVTPDGHPVLSLGVNNVNPSGDTGLKTGRAIYGETVEAAYDSTDDWADAAVARLQSWGFNTAGCWSTTEWVQPRMAFTPIAGLADYDWRTGERGDWFEPAWTEAVQAQAESVVAPLADEPNLLGWFLDNEIGWGPDWRGLDTLLQAYLAMDAAAAGKAAAVDLLLEELGDVDAVNAALGTSFAARDELLAATEGWDALDQGSSDTEAALTSAFLTMAAEHYFSTTVEAIRAAAPNHLVLGNREISVMTRLEVFQAAAQHLDVISINNYVFTEGIAEGALNLSGGLDPAEGFAALHAEIDLPVLVSEFGFRAADSGLPNSWPPFYPTYDTQAERADAFADYARYHQSVPWIAGYHWFEWVDEPADGRFDGEDNNWGLVDEQDQVYEELTARMTEVNAEVWEYLEVGD